MTLCPGWRGADGDSRSGQQRNVWCVCQSLPSFWQTTTTETVRPPAPHTEVEQVETPHTDRSQQGPMSDSLYVIDFETPKHIHIRWTAHQGRKVHPVWDSQACKILVVTVGPCVSHYKTSLHPRKIMLCIWWTTNYTTNYRCGPVLAAVEMCATRTNRRTKIWWIARVYCSLSTMPGRMWRWWPGIPRVPPSLAHSRYKSSDNLVPTAFTWSMGTITC